MWTVLDDLPMPTEQKIKLAASRGRPMHKSAEVQLNRLKAASA